MPAIVVSPLCFCAFLATSRRKASAGVSSRPPISVLCCIALYCTVLYGASFTVVIAGVVAVVTICAMLYCCFGLRRGDWWSTALDILTRCCLRRVCCCRCFLSGLCTRGCLRCWTVKGSAFPACPAYLARPARARDSGIAELVQQSSYPSRSVVVYPAAKLALLLVAMGCWRRYNNAFPLEFPLRVSCFPLPHCPCVWYGGRGLRGRLSP